jgi:hypothetical protein
MDRRAVCRHGGDRGGHQQAALATTAPESGGLKGKEASAQSGDANLTIFVALRRSVSVVMPYFPPALAEVRPLSSSTFPTDGSVIP